MIYNNYQTKKIQKQKQKKKLNFVHNKLLIDANSMGQYSFDQYITVPIDYNVSVITRLTVTQP